MSETKSVLITGAGRGIGRALCVEALARGYRVHAMVRKQEDAPQGTVPHVADVREREKVAQLLETLASELTVFIANAGIDGRYNPKDPRAPEKAVELFEINGTATAFSLLLLAREWVRLGRRGHLAVVSSLAAGRGAPKAGLYISTKLAQMALCESIEHDLAPYGVGVSVIQPGFIRTDMTEKLKVKPFLLEANEAARVIWNGIERGKFRIAFPFGTRLGAWIRDSVPFFVYRWACRLIARRNWF